MQQTTNCGLKKPEANEYYNVGDFNYNADVIDAALKGLEDGKADIGPDGKVPADKHQPGAEQGGQGGAGSEGG